MGNLIAGSGLEFRDVLEVGTTIEPFLAPAKQGETSRETWLVNTQIPRYIHSSTKNMYVLVPVEILKLDFESWSDTLKASTDTNRLD